jgi:four helix bundle protein
MATITCFEEIESWKKARELCQKSGLLIDEGRYKNNCRLIGQLEGSTGSIMDNIAEGFERGSRLEFIQFLGYAKGSCGEVRSQLYRALDRNYITQIEFDDLKESVMHISRLIQKLIGYLQKTTIDGTRRRVRPKEL